MMLEITFMSARRQSECAAVGTRPGFWIWSEHDVVLFHAQCVECVWQSLKANQPVVYPAMLDTPHFEWVGTLYSRPGDRFTEFSHQERRSIGASGVPIFLNLPLLQQCRSYIRGSRPDCRKMPCSSRW